MFVNYLGLGFIFRFNITEDEFFQAKIAKSKNKFYDTHVHGSKKKKVPPEKYFVLKCQFKIKLPLLSILPQKHEKRQFLLLSAGHKKCSKLW